VSELKLPSKEGKETSVNIRLTLQDRKKMEKVAKHLKLSFSDYARQALIEVTHHFAERLGLSLEVLEDEE
jgi:hypothetical protein